MSQKIPSNPLGEDSDDRFNERDEQSGASSISPVESTADYNEQRDLTNLPNEFNDDSNEAQASNFSGAVGYSQELSRTGCTRPNIPLRTESDEKCDSEKSYRESGEEDSSRDSPEELEARIPVGEGAVRRVRGLVPVRSPSPEPIDDLRVLGFNNPGVRLCLRREIVTARSQGRNHHLDNLNGKPLRLPTEAQLREEIIKALDINDKYKYMINDRNYYKQLMELILKKNITTDTRTDLMLRLWDFEKERTVSCPTISDLRRTRSMEDLTSDEDNENVPQQVDFDFRNLMLAQDMMEVVNLRGSDQCINSHEDDKNLADNLYSMRRKVHQFFKEMKEGKDRLLGKLFGEWRLEHEERVKMAEICRRVEGECSRAVEQVEESLECEQQRPEMENRSEYEVIRAVEELIESVESPGFYSSDIDTDRMAVDDSMPPPNSPSIEELSPRAPLAESEDYSSQDTKSDSEPEIDRNLKDE